MDVCRIIWFKEPIIWPHFVLVMLWVLVLFFLYFRSKIIYRHDRIKFRIGRSKFRRGKIKSRREP